MPSIETTGSFDSRKYFRDMLAKLGISDIYTPPFSPVREFAEEAYNRLDRHSQDPLFGGGAHASGSEGSRVGRILEGMQALHMEFEVHSALRAAHYYIESAGKSFKETTGTAFSAGPDSIEQALLADPSILEESRRNVAILKTRKLRLPANI